MATSSGGGSEGPGQRPRLARAHPTSRGETGRGETGRREVGRREVGIGGEAHQTSRREVGIGGEAAVAAWYEARGYEVIARNWRCRQGEMDLIVRQGRQFVFCEVKTRTTTAFGEPVEAVTGEKRQRLRHVAARWLADAPVHPGIIRFDVASVLAGKIEVVEGAF